MIGLTKTQHKTKKTGSRLRRSDCVVIALRQRGTIIKPRRSMLIGQTKEKYLAVPFLLLPGIPPLQEVGKPQEVPHLAVAVHQRAEHGAVPGEPHSESGGRLNNTGL